MTNIEKLSISLPRDMVTDLKDAVESGSHASVSEVVRDAVRHWQKQQIVERHDALKPKSLAHLRQMIRQGIASADRGEVKTAEEVFDRLRAKYERTAKTGTGKVRPARIKRRA